MYEEIKRPRYLHTFLSKQAAAKFGKKKSDGFSDFVEVMFAAFQQAQKGYGLADFFAGEVKYSAVKTLIDSSGHFTEWTEIRNSSNYEKDILQKLSVIIVDCIKKSKSNVGCSWRIPLAEALKTFASNQQLNK
jgi:hypothetical protein